MSSFLMYIDKMSVKSDDSSNCIYSASSSSQAANSGAVLYFTIFLIYFLFFSTGIIRALGRSPVLLWILFSTWSAVGFWRLLEKYNIFIIAFGRGKKKKMFKIFISKCSKLCSDFHTLYLLGNDF